MKILRWGGGLRKFLDTQKGGSETIVELGGGGGGAQKICRLQTNRRGGRLLKN